MEDRYEVLKELGSGSSGVVRLARDKLTDELVAVKYIPRGIAIGENVRREIINHRSLRHRNIVRFKELSLTPTHLAIVMEYAAGGDLYEKISSCGPIGENEARCLFQQLISGVGYCHSMNICHRDLKLENSLLDGSASSPCLKICDFGYSKSGLPQSKARARIGTPAYVAPEVLLQKEFDGAASDVWSAGVTLFVLLCGSYPFEDPKDTKNHQKTARRVMNVNYSFPASVPLSLECRDLLSRIFVFDPAKRITIPDIKKHPWFLKNLATERETETHGSEEDDHHHPAQSDEEIMRIIQEARVSQEDFQKIEQAGMPKKNISRTRCGSS